MVTSMDQGSISIICVRITSAHAFKLLSQAGKEISQCPHTLSRMWNKYWTMGSGSNLWL